MVHSDFLDLLRLLNDFKIKYLIIGGYAVGFYSEPRYTKDIDIWIEASKLNAKKVLKMLKKFGAPTDNLTEEELAKPGLIYIFGIPPLRVDIINKLKGASFSTAFKLKNRFKMGELIVSVVDKKTLISLKKKANRPQDKLDIIKLQNDFTGK